MSIVLSEESQQGYFAKLFKSNVEELTEGRYSVKIIANEQLAGGDGPKAIEMLQQGAIDLDLHFDEMFMTYEPKLGITNMPFLFKSADEMKKSLDNGLADELGRLMYEKAHVKALGFAQVGFKNFVGKKIFRSPADLVGVKMRCANSLTIEVFKMYGAMPISLSVGEVFTALQQGTADAAGNFWMYLSDQHYYEVAPNVTVCPYQTALMVLTMNRAKFEALPPEDQKHFLDASEYAVDLFREYMLQDDIKLREEISKTANVVELTDEENQAFFDAAKDFYISKREVFGDELYRLAGIDVDALLKK
jgi:TRAP-type C4-dicarboxylate transport system substrate-binding protein